MQILYDSEHRILRITARGPWPTAETHIAAQRELAALQLPPDAGVLIDLRNAERNTEPAYQDIVSRARRGLGSLPARRAYVMRPGVQFGAARQIQALAPPGVTIEVFTDEAQALAWLLGSE